MTESGLLDDELKVLRDGFAERAPQLMETVEAAIEEIEAATIARALDVGASAPDFPAARCHARPRRESERGAGPGTGGCLVLPGRVVTVLQHRAAGSAATA